MTTADLPLINAGLNLLSFILLVIGYGLVRFGKKDLHACFMISAVVVSTAFLIGYLYYHFHYGSTHFQKTGWIRKVYFSILWSHTILAITLPFLVVKTLSYAVKKHFDAHRRLARWTLPIWAYVSITGVAIYWMLYRLL